MSVLIGAPPAQLDFLDAPGIRARDPRGGTREGAGRKAVVPGRQPHVARPAHAKRYPVHVTLRVVRDVPRLRRWHVYRALRGAFRAGALRADFRLVQYSVQGNHLHLLCEADDARALSRGMQGLAIRVARTINRKVERRGRVFSDRYHAEELRSPTQTRSALIYVLNNFLKHERFTERIHGPVDPFSSAAHFGGWLGRVPHFVLADAGPPICAPAKTWLLDAGWSLRGGGPLKFSEMPKRRSG